MNKQLETFEHESQAQRARCVTVTSYKKSLHFCFFFGSPSATLHSSSFAFQSNITIMLLIQFNSQPTNRKPLQRIRFETREFWIFFSSLLSRWVRPDEVLDCFSRSVERMRGRHDKLRKLFIERAFIASKKALNPNEKL